MTNQPIHPIREQAIHEFLHGDKKLAWQLNQRATLAERIEKACATTEPNTKARNSALAAIKWILRTPNGQYAALDKGQWITVVDDIQQAVTFDARDNEEEKRAYYSAVTGLTFEVMAA